MCVYKYIVYRKWLYIENGCISHVYKICFQIKNGHETRNSRGHSLGHFNLRAPAPLTHYYAYACWVTACNTINFLRDIMIDILYWYLVIFA